MPLETPSRPLAVVFALALSGATFGVPAAAPLAGQVFGTGMAFADDDDDGGGGGGSSSGSRDSSASGQGVGKGRSLFDLFRKPEPSRKAAARPAPALVRQAPQEIVALGLDQGAITNLTAAGYLISDRADVALAGAEIVKLRVPSGTTLQAARAEVAAAAPNAVVDFNHFYRPDQDRLDPCGADLCLARHVVGWPETEAIPDRCTAPVRIGLIDTAINAEHLAFAGGRIETIRLGKGDLPESARQHGTAVAALLVGSAGSRTPGLVPGGELVAVDAFQRNGNDDRSAVYDLVRAIDLLAGKGVLVINMSLTGPANLLLERTVEMATQREIVLVAAAGNGGPRAAPLYPGAYDEVIAVTAIDRHKNAYRRAGAGDHIDIAAPGVQVWTAASVKGASSKTGTSFAAPFVTAAAAMIKAANPQLKGDEVEALLRQGAEDLGKPGKDPVFGWGLLNARTICQS
ncbi:S8 family serine peptidase (plasmid) [Aminobacter sp. UC22_36]|uniref:S8 family serine peptidase n=1 Tax=Aminobacter sp. UC22_36 TaxID=3374549 RepID=UPI0037574133